MAAELTTGTFQHALHDPDAPIVYTADFDSVASGTGAVRKLLTDLDALLLMRAGATGQQAHMVGLARSASIIAGEILIGTSGVVRVVTCHRPADGVWIFRTIATGVTTYWRVISVNPFNPTEWIALGNDSDSRAFDRSAGGAVVMRNSTTTPLWYSSDAGVTWSPVALTGVSGGASNDAYFIDTVVWAQTGGGWQLIVGDNTGSFAGIRYTGSGATADAPTRSTDSTLYTIVLAGVERDLVTIKGNDAGGTYPIRYWADAAANPTEPSGTDPNSSGATDMESLPGVARSVVVPAPASTGALWATSDYRSAQPRLRITVGALTGPIMATMAAATHGLYVMTATAIRRVTDILGTPAVADVFSLDGTNIPIVVDAQTRTLLAAVNGSTNPALIWISADGETWQTVYGPNAAANTLSRFAVAVIGRSS